MWGKTPKTAPEPAVPPPAPPDSAPFAETRTVERTAPSASIGRNIAIRGEVTGSEDLRIEGELHGSVCLRDAVVTVGPSGRIRADIEAREIVVQGSVEGTLTGAERVCIGASGVVQGEVHTRRIAIEEGAILQGSVDIVRPEESRRVAAKSFAAAASSSGALAATVAAVEQNDR